MEEAITAVNVTKEEKKALKAAAQAEKAVRSLAVYRRARENFLSRATVYIAIDIETWERNHDRITEIGLSINTGLQVSTRHLRIAEYDLDYLI